MERLCCQSLLFHISWSCVWLYICNRLSVLFHHLKTALRCLVFTRRRYIAATKVVAFAKRSHPAQDSQTVADMRRRSVSALGKKTLQKHAKSLFSQKRVVGFKTKKIFYVFCRLSEDRVGDICNACVLLVKRWKKLPHGSKKNWKHVSLIYLYKT